MRRTAADPAAATAAPEGNAAPQGQTDTSAATAKPDEQMLNSSAPSGGTPMPTPATPTQASFAVACLDCGQDYTFGRVTANMRCFCGSENLVYEALTLNDEIEAMDKGFVLSPYPVGPTNGLGPAQLRALTPYFEVGHVLTHEEELALGLVAPDSDAAPSHVAVKVSNLAPMYAGARTGRGWYGNPDDNPKPSCGSPGCKHHPQLQSDGSYLCKNHADYGKTASLGVWVAADFPPKKDDKDKKDDDDKGGNETHPPSGESGGEEAPAPAAGTPGEPTQEGTQPPGAVQVDPNAPPAPGAVPGEVADPLLQVMDMAQQQVDAAVEQANQLGHDAKEVAYDVDQLFSNWRCQNCQIEGEANISDDGQTSLDGDLFANQPCAAPAPPEENQNQEGQVPQQNQQNQLPQGAPATNDQIPATQQNLPSQTASRTCKKCHGSGKVQAGNDRGEKCLSCNGQGHTSTGESLDKRATDGDGDDPDQRNVLDQQTAPNNNLAKEERLTAMVEQILDTNPGMNAQAARRVAETTLAKFPSLVA